MMSYCAYINTIQDKARRDIHQNYHDRHYGFPIGNDNELFGRLIMEINQAGLSWETILKKESSFRLAYSNFDIAAVAKYDDNDKERLLADPGIVRNRLKINAAIENAKMILQLQREYGSFNEWLRQNHPLEKDGWVRLFKKTFRFTGGEIVGEFLMSIGILPGAHVPKCPIYNQVLESHPLWRDSPLTS